MLGFFRSIEQSKTYELLPLVGVGFALNLMTGILFFFGDPQRYAINIAFQIKMLLVLLAGLNALFYHFRIEPRARGASLGLNAALPRVSASVSLLTWTAVLLFGRLIPYIGTG